MVSNFFFYNVGARKCFGTPNLVIKKLFDPSLNNKMEFYYAKWIAKEKF